MMTASGFRPLAAACTSCSRRALSSGAPAKTVTARLFNDKRPRETVCHAAPRKVAAAVAEPPSEEFQTEEEIVATDLTASAYQQTLHRSICLGGVGLHSGEYAYVRVRPAFAGDGRYFVIVPEGTNAKYFDVESEARKLKLLEIEKDDPQFQSKQMGAFMQFLRAQEDGYDGTFETYLADVGLDELTGVGPMEFVASREDPVPRTDDDITVDAHVDNIQRTTPFCTVLSNDDAAVASVEHLLATLEALHVDNARIEIEGGREVPILDGSALCWADDIAEVGVRHAQTAEGQFVRKMTYLPQCTVSVSDGDSFIALYPSDEPKVSVGIESFADAIGKQWMTYETYGSNDCNFAMDIAPARTYIESTEVAYKMKDMGYLRAGTVGCVMIADGENWIANADVRFLADEPVRHAVMDLLGDLSLLGMVGNTGIPHGHIVAWKPNHHLQAEFVRAVLAEIKNESMELVPFLVTHDEKLRLEKLEEDGTDINDLPSDVPGFETEPEGDVEGGATSNVLEEDVLEGFEDEESEDAESEDEGSIGGSDVDASGSESGDD